jgi:hypothetical protein
LDTFAARFVSPEEGQPGVAPRLPSATRPTIPQEGSIPSSAKQMPETITFSPDTRRLHVGTGHVNNVSPEIWAYTVSGKQVVAHWFSYRGRPMIGDRRTPSPLGGIQPAGWLAEYTTELMNVLNVLGRLVALEPAQADLLARICAGPTISNTALQATVVASPAEPSPSRRTRRSPQGQGNLLA